MITVILLFLVFCAATKYALDKGAVIIVSAVRRFMVGGLYNVDTYEEEGIKEHTIQFCFILVTFTYQWTKDIG